MEIIYYIVSYVGWFDSNVSQKILGFSADYRLTMHMWYIIPSKKKKKADFILGGIKRNWV